MYSDSNSVRVARVGNGASVSIPPELYNFQSQTEITPKYNTDWQDELYRNAQFMRHNLSFSGGGKNATYYISGSYQNQDGIMLNTGQQRVNFRANVDGSVTEKLKVEPASAIPGIPTRKRRKAAGTIVLLLAR